MAIGGWLLQNDENNPEEVRTYLINGARERSGLWSVDLTKEQRRIIEPFRPLLPKRASG